jgi:hypothetical protein
MHEIVQRWLSWHKGYVTHGTVSGPGPPRTDYVDGEHGSVFLGPEADEEELLMAALFIVPPGTEARRAIIGIIKGDRPFGDLWLWDA